MKKIIETIKSIIPIDNKLVSNLYSISEKSLWVILILNILITYFLLPLVGSILYIWSGLFLLLILYRFIMIYRFKNHKYIFSFNVWYINFVVSALATALFIAVLPLFLLQYPEDILPQLLIIMFVVGYTSGSHTALASDIRIAVAYVLVLTLPLIASLLSYSSDLYNILSLFIFIHMLALILILWVTYKQQNKMLLQEKKITKVMQKLDNKKSLLNHFIKESPLSIFVCDIDLNIVDVNKTLVTLINRKKKQLIGINIKRLPNKPFVQAIKKAMREGSSQYSGEYHSEDGVHLWIESIFIARYNAKKEPIGVMALIDDKTKEHNAIKKLKYISTHDKLTHLLNRRGFLKAMSKQMQIGEKDRSYSILFYLDLNQFKVINDTSGHTIGDQVLTEVATRLDNLGLEQSIISRFGGDEFVLLVPNTALSNHKALEISKHYSEAIQNIFLKPFIIEKMHFHISTSMGIIVFQANETNMENIIRHADLTMYRAKKTKTHISYYDSSLDEKQKELFALQHDLSYAIEHKEFRLYFQPIVNMSNNTIASSELLIRWEHPDKGLLLPDVFIPLAIKAGLLSKITWWLIDEVCQQIVTWKKAKQWKLNYISVNINATHLMEQDFVTSLLSMLNSYAIETSEIVLEITERSLIDNFAQTQEVISKLKSEGILCAIDDFGVGYSSLSYLHKLPCSILKIDRSFVESIKDNNKEVILLSAIINIGKEFGYKMAIEGIEREEQKDLLTHINGTLLGQGYMYSKPLDIDTFTQKFLS